MHNASQKLLQSISQLSEMLMRNLTKPISQESEICVKKCLGSFEDTWCNKPTVERSYLMKPVMATYSMHISDTQTWSLRPEENKIKKLTESIFISNGKKSKGTEPGCLASSCYTTERHSASHACESPNSFN